MIRPLIALALGSAAVVLVATGTLPATDAGALAGRVVPVLLFVVGITVVAELAAEAGVFDLVSHAFARVARGRVPLLWALVVVLAVLSTAFLSLDTTAVLVTPVVVVLARQVGIPPIPFAMATVWLANTASLLLPVSNLTNLLAAGLLDRDAPGFLALAWAPALVGVVLPVLVLSVRYRRILAGSFTPLPREHSRDRVLLVAASVVVAALVPLLVSGVPVEYPALAAAVVLIALFVVRRRSALAWSMAPWFPVLVAGGLFVVVATMHARGLADAVTAWAGGGTSAGDLVRLAATGAVAANGIDNLPAYLVLEPAAAGDPTRLVALLIGVNLGPLVTPWASLAALLWHERLASLGVGVRWRSYSLAGLGLVVVLVPLAALALAITAD
ncbi:SLC13 family permease [Galbitalea sp. SE-J8]|nr:SLC13 family permease [Galbitalea sp. SE-J8]MDM4761634.1 SLC13 family permease [Galbitalea sp. SE-J8]